MLTTLRIKNLALAADLELEFQRGYNVITGETGAGKSILIGALNLVLGQRADRTLIRSGSETCSVEAVFDIGDLTAPLRKFLENHGLEPCEEDQLVLKRSFTNAGVNRQFINGSPTTLNILSAVGDWLVDIHGPHEHQSLLQPARQLAILDAFGGLETEREAFAELLLRRLALESEKASLIVDERTYAQQVDLLRFQTNEVTSAQLQPEEESRIEQDYRRASNSAKLLQLSQAALDLLSQNDSSLLTQAGIIGRTLQELARLDESATSLITMHEQAIASLNDLQAELSRYADKVEVEPARLRELEQRLDVIQGLKRKYGPTLSEVLAFGEEARRKLVSLEQRETELQRINSQWDALASELWRSGNSLSARRRKLIPQLNKAAAKQLADLGFQQSRFDVSLVSLAQNQLSGHGKTSDGPPISPTGLDTIEFQFAPNPGEPAKPLRAIASSGELARVMLALKTVLAQQDQIPLLVFDEVDANVGGETANAVGEKMCQIARSRQVLCITHLPQVAACASAHYVATKQVKAGRTISEITLLDNGQRVTELARMLGGQTDAARKHAQALLASAQK
jgi:DNA repair protein RecN (Recombination protein N)